MSATRHWTDPLTEPEIAEVIALVSADPRIGERPRFWGIAVDEGLARSLADGQGRPVRLIVMNPDDHLAWEVAAFTSGTDRPASISAWPPVDAKRPGVSSEEARLVAAACRADAGIQAALAKRGIFTATGLLFAAASISADGDDLRPSGGDVGSLLRERSDRIDSRRDDAQALRAQIDQLSSGVGGDDLDKVRERVADLEPATGLTAMRGPGVRVTLTDAPRTGNDPDIDLNLLVVHQQDIQAYVNALWAGGAEAISLQGQRLMSTTGIKCVGNTVVLDGVPYSPPYVIEAIGDVGGMNRAMAQSPETSTYADYSRIYDLGLQVEQLRQVTVKAYANPVSLTHARIAG